MHYFSFTGFETDNGTGVVGCLFKRIFFQSLVRKSSFIGKRFIEFDNEVVFKILRYSSAITCSVTDDFVLFR